MPQIVRCSVVQTCTAAYSLSDTLDKLERLTRLAKERDNSQLAVFPEAFIGGYPAKSTFGTIVGARSKEGRDEYQRYHSSAVEIPSAATSRIEAVSKETGVFLVVGVIEKDGGTCYCTIVFVHPQKGYIGKHRKLMPTAAERLIWGFGDGSTIPVLQESFADDERNEVTAKLSATICWENYMPLLRTHYYQQGTQLYCAPTVDSRPVWQHTMAHIAIEGRCFVLSACQYAQQKDFPADHAIASDAKRDPEGVMIGGGSVIYNPLGEPVVGPLVEGEGVLTASLDLDDIVRGKFDLDVVGHYARPDIMAPSSIKRASPGVEDLKNGLVDDISEGDALKLVELAKEQKRLDILLERKHIEIMQSYFEKRREVLKTIPNFWSKALRNMPGIAMQLQHEMDQDAMKYLDDIWIVRDSVEPRCCSIEFHFKPNPYFTDSILKKEFKYLPPIVPDNTPDENGITPAMMEFDWEQHVAPQAIKINWKDDAKNLTKLYSRVRADEEDGDDDDIAEAGSFFNFFEYPDDIMETGTNIISELFPEALEWFRGMYGIDEDESSEEDEDDEDEDEIDLEKPRKKKQKTE